MPGGSSWPASLMVNPTMSKAISSAMITVVNISRPSGSLRCPSSASTLATMPRLDSAKTPDSASAEVKGRSRTKWVTPSAARRGTITDTVAATKNRPRIVATKPEMSTSSSPIRKKKTKTPTLKKRADSSVGSTTPRTGPRRTPVAV